jgi:hypothetical protein
MLTAIPAVARTLPDYHGGSIVNLMSSIIYAHGGQPTAPLLRGLALEPLATATNLVLLVLDGLGAEWLERHSPTGILNRARCCTMTSVFPSTTAAAITTYLTGTAPLQHGLTGWFTYLRELGCVMAVLTGKPRYGGQSYQAAGVAPATLFRQPPLFDQITTPSVIIAPHFIAHSDFNLAHRGRAQLASYDGLADLFRQLRQKLRRPRGTARQLVYAYWPLLDSIGHKHGIDSAVAVAHLGKIEQEIEHFMTAAAGTNTRLLVSADHGQIDTSAADQIALEDHPELAECLVLPLCGEPRAAFCYVRAGRVSTFETYCQQVLADQVDMVPSQDLSAAGYFGLGTPHPHFDERIGDYCLLPRGTRVIRDHLPSEKSYTQIGVHGGLSSAELLVPLCLL